jgi:NAD-dependent dihydropyrimidine dehydrogenase PreA subunit
MPKNSYPIRTNIHTCVGCNKCIRICPVATSNVAFLDRHGRIKVRTDNTKCLACGACIAVCHRRARHYLDDTDRFFHDIEKGRQISLLISPSFVTNFPDYKLVLNYLRHIGVNQIYDISYGVDIYIWAHLRHLERVRPFTMITTYCPVLAAYCELHRPELLPRLSPIRSPTSIMATYLKNNLGNHDDLAVLSPCLCKSAEFDPTKENLKYALTFARLREHILKNNPHGLPAEESEFDNRGQIIGSGLSLYEGFNKSMEFFSGNSIRIDQFSGQRVFRLLDVYASSDPDDVPPVLSLVSCEMGCSLGPGRLPDLSRFKINKISHLTNASLYAKDIKDRYLERHAEFDRDLNLTSFYQQFIPTPFVQDYVPEDRIEQAFIHLGKRTVAQRTIDCYACGATTCRDMAIRIALGVNIPQNCTILAKETISATNKRFTDYLHLIRVMGEYVLATGQRDKFDSIENSLMALCSAFNASRASIWKTSYDSLELPRCDIILSFPSMRLFNLGPMTSANMPEWLETLGDGELVIRSSLFKTLEEKQFFAESGFDNLCCIPIMAEGDFWGFLMIVRGPQMPFAREEISVIESASFLIVSNLISFFPTESNKSDNLGEIA